jgi:hypothetical protein
LTQIYSLLIKKINFVEFVAMLQETTRKFPLSSFAAVVGSVIRAPGSGFRDPGFGILNPESGMDKYQDPG